MYIRCNKDKIADGAGCGRNTVTRTLARAREQRLSWQQVQTMSPQEVTGRLFPAEETGSVYKIADLLESATPADYHGANRTKTIRECNDVLQGRSDVSIDMLADLLEENSKEIDLAKAKLKLAHEQLSEKQAEYETLRAETIKVLQGKSRLNVDLLNSLVAETEEAIKSLEMQIQTAQAELQERLDSADIVRREYAQLVSWADMYDHCTFEAKKMIIAQFIKAVYVRRDYEIEIEFNVSFEEFQNLYFAKGVSV